MSTGSLLRGALWRLLGGGRPRAGGRRPDGDDAQLALDFAPPPPSPAAPPAVASPDVRARRATRVADASRGEELLRRLRALGLREGEGGIGRLRLTRNRTVMVSFRRGELRVHRGYLDAPEEVLRAIVAFVHARTRRQRAAAQRVILAHPAAHADRAGEGPRRARARERTLPEDEPMARVLAEWHGRYNAQHFGGALGAIPIRVSRRLKTRLGHYSARTGDGLPAEIVIGRAHVRRHGWEEALHTLLHEMVHQWQDEAGHPIDHGRTFRCKAREVGITAAARRAVGRHRDEAARGAGESHRRRAG